MLFPENIGPYLSIDEPQGELYTFIANKAGKGRQGTLVASIKGTLTKDIVSVLEKLPLDSIKTVKEVTMDMANNMSSATRQSFPKSKLVIDRFHVIRLAIEALQHIRINYRWEELDIENIAIEKARKRGKKYKPAELENGDTPKQLLACCRYIIAKKPNEWTLSQQKRAALLFNRYPILKEAYHHVLQLRNIFELRIQSQAEQCFIEWINN